MDEAEYCDRVALIYRGQVIALGRAGRPAGARQARPTLPHPDPGGRLHRSDRGPRPGEGRMKTGAARRQLAAHLGAGPQGDLAGRARSFELRRRLRPAGAPADPVRLRRLVRRHAHARRASSSRSRRPRRNLFVASLSNTRYLRGRSARPTAAPSSTSSPPGALTASSCWPAISRSGWRAATRRAIQVITDGSDPNTAASSPATCRARGRRGSPSAR